MSATSIVFGEAAIFRSFGVGVWGAAFFVLNAIYIPMVEEPGLAQRFGDDYEVYRTNVPRWIPRLSSRAGI